MRIVSRRRERSASVTHDHIMAAIMTLIEEQQASPRDGRLRLLDIGCGDGDLVNHLQRALADALPGLQVEVYGFDIGEQGYKDGDQFDVATSALAARLPWIDWRERISLQSDGEPWRYPSGFFDIAVSNQVIEHVTDLTAFLAELRRCLAPEGASVHVFPLSSCIVEAHCQTPFAHWIRDFDRRVGWILWMSRLRIGSYRRHHEVLGHGNRRDHAVQTARYIQCWTHYRDFRAVADQCAAAGLSVASGLTKGLFIAKLRSMLRLAPPRRYRRSRVMGLDWLSFAIGRHLSSATLVLRPASYDIGRRIAAEKAARAYKRAA